MKGAVVVGVSPTTGSPSALRWAAVEARMRSVPLRAVMAWHNPRPAGATGTRAPMTPAPRGDEVAVAAEQELRDFVAVALGSDATEVDCSVVRGSAVNALLSAARDASLLVVGEPQPGRMNSVRASLVAPQLVLKAGCPVVVMPAAEPLIG